MTRDQLGALAAIILALIGLVVVLVSWSDGRRDHVGEYYALLAASAAGMVFIVSASSLLTMFLALEWFSIALYILCALDTHRRESLEAGLKYLIIGSFGSGVLLFGCALVYGSTGELGFSAIREATGADDPLFVTGMAMILAGLAFKVSAAPFHMWTPDVYQGAPTSVTAFMAGATKVAALVVTLRILVTAFPEQAEIWSVAVAVLAVASLAIGNLAAIAQRDVKRMLAYSSVSHAGFLLIAIAANSDDGATSLLYYLIPYTAATVGAFAVVAARERELGKPVSLSNLEGLGWERPFLGDRDVGLHAQPRRLPADRRLPRQAVRLLGDLRGGLVVARRDRRARHRASRSRTTSTSCARSTCARARSLAGAVVAAGGSPPRDLLLEAAVAAGIVVTIGSFFFVQPLVDLARDAAASLPL